jgi:hypothetical protein
MVIDLAWWKENNIEKEQKNYYYDGITQILIIEFELV